VNSRAVKWAVALFASALLHAGAAVWLGGPGTETVAVAGGAQAEIAVLGNAFQDSLAAGVTTGPVEPAESEAEAIRPTETEATAETMTEPVLPTPPATASHADAAAREPAAAEAGTEPIEPTPDGIAIAALQPKPEETQQPTANISRESPALEPVDEQELPVIPQAAPRPTPRPEQVAEAKQRAPETPEKAKAPAKRQASAGGNAGQSTRRGSADGSKQAQEASSGNAGRAREAGNAAVSNYPGTVYAKLRRSLRYPSEARRKRIRGEVHVRFTVSRSGGVGSVGVARSSGSPLLDNAALETVRRAAPFPEIPPAAGRSSWSFTVPLAFTR
jgi:protein TonB